MRAEIVGMPELPGMDSMSEIEELLALDTVMMCIRGDAEHFLRDQVGIFDQTVRINLGDLPNSDWDAMMKAVQGTFKADGKNPSF